MFVIAYRLEKAVDESCCPLTWVAGMRCVLGKSEWPLSELGFICCYI
jgi:hypothetical protein